MRRRSAVTTAALSALAILTVACGQLPAAPGDEPSESAPPVETSEAPDPDPSSAGDPTSLEGIFGYNDMDDYVAAVIDPIIVGWLNDTWPGIPIPQVDYVSRGEQGYEGCTDSDGGAARFTSESYEYCPPDNTVYLGQDLLWEFYQLGDAAPAMGIAHEFGHHVQEYLGVDPPYTAAQSVDYENQADCLAGSWAKWANEQDPPILETAENSPNGQSDLDDIEEIFPLIASGEGDDERDHGTQTEREDAFFAGYDTGATACGLPRG